MFRSATKKASRKEAFGRVWAHLDTATKALERPRKADREPSGGGVKMRPPSVKSEDRHWQTLP